MKWNSIREGGKERETSIHKTIHCSGCTDLTYKCQVSALMRTIQASVTTATAQNMIGKTSCIKMVAKVYKPSLGENGVRFPPRRDSCICRWNPTIKLTRCGETTAFIQISVHAVQIFEEWGLNSPYRWRLAMDSKTTVSGCNPKRMPSARTNQYMRSLQHSKLEWGFCKWTARFSLGLERHLALEAHWLRGHVIHIYKPMVCENDLEYV